MKCLGITNENRKCERDEVVKGYCVVHLGKKKRKIIQCPKCKSEKIDRYLKKNKCLECENKW